MFTAILVVCAGGSLSSCLLFQDTRGPYITESECKVRLKELTPDATELFQQAFPDVTNATFTAECAVAAGKGPIITL